MNPQKQRELDDDLAFLRDQFDALNVQIKLPHSLDADMLRCKLEHLDLIEQKPAKGRPWMRPLIGMAACFVVVFGSFLALRGMDGLRAGDMKSAPAPADLPMAVAYSAAPEAAAFSLDEEAPQMQAGYAENYTVLRDAVFEMNGGASYYSSTEGSASLSLAAAANEMLQNSPETMGNDQAVAGAPPMADAAERRLVTDDGFSATNTQERGVDEADIVKTDGQYLYSYVQQNTTSKGPAIFITDAATMTLSSKIELSDMGADEFYIADNRLITVSSGYDDRLYRNLKSDETIVSATDDSVVRAIESNLPAENRMMTEPYGGEQVSEQVSINIYDIGNRAKPKQIQNFSQQGIYTSSRMIGDALYLVSEYDISPALDNRNAPLSELVPIVYDGKASSVLPANRIALAPQCSSPCYAVVSTVDVKTGVSDTQAVLGGSDGIYMSSDSLYVYYDVYREQTAEGQSLSRTGVIRFDVGEKLLLGKTGFAEGRVEGQFSLSEKDGNLRIATTVQPLSGEPSNSVYVFDREMKQIGALEKLAPNERIYAARYVGDLAYLVTFRETDPLFVIDLADPNHPKLLGQLKIPGFSEYLHPIDDKTLLGIGQATDAQGSVTGLKLSLFDVSNPLSPKELNVYNLGAAGSWSEALDNHKSVMFNPTRSMFAFPAQIATAQGGNETAYFVFTYDRTNGFTLEKAITHTASDPYSAFHTVQRGLYIGDTLYTFSDEKIVSYDLTTFAEEKTLVLK